MSFAKKIAVPAYVALLCFILGTISALLRGNPFAVALVVGAAYAGLGLTFLLLLWGLVKVAVWSEM